jgi:hypothetical protein
MESRLRARVICDPKFSRLSRKSGKRSHTSWKRAEAGE